MVEEISEYYKNKGFVKVYILQNKEPRRLAVMYKENGETLTLSYAKYLYTSYYKKDIEKGFEIDHINSNKLDDRIENLQEVSAKYNRQKDHSIKEMIVLKCPVCGNEFLFEKRNLNSHPNPCCSRICGGKKSHWK